MSTVTLNGTSHVVDQKVIDLTVLRLHRKLLVVRNATRGLPVDYLTVKSELNRMYPSIQQKKWYADFLLHFCREYRINVPRVENL